ncbi:ANTAR domain-containing protein [Egibacter rhizosphaerae]|uniref:ANTAR domain-containing protein n=1 Tax=Egibacter rhizosphaerae TaxID=1670831 RepID=A0A411YFU3_9ACTN|nr:GAF and ANTAR domain-containing protein [Egibacter rhizosphaerae]QBI20100.1 ANTAR domain-containing protein [Egibacter rhizosphaerae]
MSDGAGRGPDRHLDGSGVPDEPDRLDRIYALVASHDGDARPFGRLQAACRAAVDLLPVTGAGVMLMSDRVHQGTIHATDERISSLEELQNAAAEGPCIDAYTLGRPVLEPDLAGRGARVWPVLARAALDAGMQALFSFPLQLDDTALGALNLYRDTPGGLDDDQADDARLLAAMIARQVLAMQAQAEPGSLPAQIADLSGDRAAIEQATGMVSSQLDVSITEAARRLRAFAGEQQRSLAEVAYDVVNRTMRLD